MGMPQHVRVVTLMVVERAQNKHKHSTRSTQQESVIMPRWAEPKAYSSCCVFVCVSAESFLELVLHVH